MKSLPKYTFTWEGFFALFLGSMIPTLIVSMLVGVAAFVLEINLQKNDYFLIFSNVVMWVGAIFAFDYFVCRIKTKKPLNFNFSLKDVSTHLLIFPMIFGMMLVAEFFTSIIPTTGFFFGSMSEFFEELMNQLTQSIELTLMLAVIMAPLFEEIVFRGIIQKGLINKGMNPTKAIWISAIAFGLVHGNPWQFVGATLLGYVLGLVYYKTESLLLPMLLHLFNNLVATLMMYYFDSEGFSELLDVPNYFILGFGIILFFVFRQLFIKKYAQ